MYLMQKDLESLIAQHPKVELVLRFDRESQMYWVYLRVDEEESPVQQLYTQRKDPKTFKDISRALAWGELQGFSSVIFKQQWK